MSIKRECDGGGLPRGVGGLTHISEWIQNDEQQNSELTKQQTYKTVNLQNSEHKTAKQQNSEITKSKLL